ncbi:undecaprenyl-diphosphate phosphatase [Pelagibius litoralis]|uniref:Undecaprenyl-diphosphatase n=1 Tax=Pelagibius litoralis TaxID=374515 RepID=A0A967C7E3_9PROT|nr:undecaprenyl-diphosphate phosphatase [Pelagibius litoralis]NIA67947.1 undecaprenyl-diphosphate phosphatase [Pelagibius litoralis]
MPLLHIVILAVVQGITEFLPISSSGHLILAWHSFDAIGMNGIEQAEQDRLTLDIAVHVGTLLAVCCYAWREIGQMLGGLGRLAVGRWTPGARLAVMIVVGTLPLILVGGLFKDQISTHLRSTAVIGWATIGFGVLLFVADRSAMTLRRIDHMTFRSGILIGLAQVLALIPGTSRSGITMTAARFLGFERVEAARFSLLLAIPAILGAGTLAGCDLYASGNLKLGYEALIGGVMAFVVALVSILLMVGWLRHASFTPFVIYRILLGGVLLWWVYAV